MSTHILVFLLWYLCCWCLWQKDISRICVMFLRLNPRSLLRETDLSLIFLSSHGYSWKRLWGEFDLIADSGISHVLRISIGCLKAEDLHGENIKKLFTRNSGSIIVKKREIAFFLGGFKTIIVFFKIVYHVMQMIPCWCPWSCLS